MVNHFGVAIILEDIPHFFIEMKTIFSYICLSTAKAVVIFFK